ncbi:hypothetical protein [Cupriavidus sp. IDO]|uniref:hypothetical protein n=1 Tax=Cupriavidus sp. IDO TaxID=1539142 RepID=UPI00126A1B91|nr:hypothetical protein [Cupriavidus sp. IDO]
MSFLGKIKFAAYVFGGQHATAKARVLSRDIRTFIYEADAIPNDADKDPLVKSKIWQRTRNCSENELLFLYAVDKEVAMLCERVAQQHSPWELL